MESIEEQGKRMLSIVVFIIVLHGFVSIVVESLIYDYYLGEAASIFFWLIIQVILLLLIHKGYTWVKFLNILLLLGGAGMYVYYVYTSSVTIEAVWYTISAIVYFIAASILSFSKSLSWYMYFKQD